MTPMIHTTEPAPAAAAACKATQVDALMICERCGLQWGLQEAAPGCAPMTFARMRERLITLLTRAEGSLQSVAAPSAGAPADPRWARREVAEVKALLRLFEHVVSDPVMRDRLNGKGK
jgi:hypothetical protein